MISLRHSLLDFLGNPAPQTRQETTAEYQDRVRRSREEQLAAQERRKREAIARKERAAHEREQGMPTSLINFIVGL